MSESDNLDTLSNAEIRAKLEELNLPNVPVTATSRSLLIKRIRKSLAGEDVQTNAKKNRRETIHVDNTEAVVTAETNTTRRGRRSVAVVEQSVAEQPPPPPTKATRRRSVQARDISPPPSAQAAVAENVVPQPSPPRTRRRSLSTASDTSDKNSKPAVRKGKRAQAQPAAILEEVEEQEPEPAPAPVKTRVPTRRQSNERKSVTEPEPRVVVLTRQPSPILEEETEPAPVRENTLPVNSLIVIDSDDDDDYNDNVDDAEEQAYVQAAAIAEEQQRRAEKQSRLGQTSIKTAVYGVGESKSERALIDIKEERVQNMLAARKANTAAALAAATAAASELPRSRIPLPPRNTLTTNLATSGTTITSLLSNASATGGVGFGLYNRPLSSLTPGEPLISTSTLPKAPASFTGRYGAQPAAPVCMPGASQRFRARSTMAATTPSIYTLRAEPPSSAVKREEPATPAAAAAAAELDELHDSEETPYASELVRSLNRQRPRPHFVSSKELNARRTLYSDEQKQPLVATSPATAVRSVVSCHKKLQLNQWQFAAALVAVLILFVIFYAKFLAP